MQVTIREAGESDLPKILPLYGQLGMDNGGILPLEQARTIFRRLKRYPDYKLFVAEAGGEIQGVMALLIMDNLGHQGAPSALVEDVVVREDRRRRGIGLELLRFAMNRAKEKRCYKLALSSHKDREGAHRFYEYLGWRQHGYSFLVEFTP
ncbi:MAG: GNAT family N-acetyltransferase [Thermodesulfobacteriota bacterium]